MIRAWLALILVGAALGGVLCGDGSRASEALVLGLMGLGLAFWMWAEEGDA